MDTEVVVIGAGVIGLSVARKIAGKGHSVILLEKEEKFGSGISSRNTEVIHAGIYYQTPLKAALCVRGKELLYRYCTEHKIRHKRIGKMILATDKEEIISLHKVKKQAIRNGVHDLVELERSDIKKLEPEVSAEAGLFSPSTGILDTHGFMKSLLQEAEQKGMIYAALSPVVGAEPIKNGWKVNVGSKEPTSISCRIVVNAAGLYSIDLSKSIFSGRNTPHLFPKKGSYARYSGEAPVKHIIYPTLTPGVIKERVDLTPDLGGQLRFGPTLEEPENLEDFSILPNLIEKIIPALRRYLPGLDVSRLHADCAGIRPRIFGPDDPVEDFRFEWAPVSGWLDLWGIESPGLTASLAIAERVYGLIAERGV